MERVDATSYLSPYGWRRVRRPVLVALSDDTYPLEPSPEESWLPIAFRAFARLGERIAVSDMLIVGTGNGLDALGAAEILHPHRLVVTDLYAEGLAVARATVLAHLVDGSDVRVSFHAGDLLSCVPPKQRFSLIYENLPNIPAGAGAELRRGTIGGRFYASGQVAEAPDVFVRHMLALHHRCLVEAQPRVRAGGGVLTAIGGRMPAEVAFALHRDCGYRPELVAFDVKRQVEPELVIPPYSRAEATGDVAFTFYAAEAIELVAAARGTGLDGQALADTVADDLGRLSMTAREAEARVGRGQSVAHSVLMIFGQRPA